jgi:serine/threonine-protein kinase RsbW
MEGVVRDSIVITNDTRFLSLVRDFMSRNLSASDLPKTDHFKVTLAVDEAVSNIMEHAYEEGISGTINIDVERSSESFTVMIRDMGRQFEPEKVKDPDMLDHVRQGKKKGLGVFLMRQIMDEVRYSFKEGKQNELVLVKYVKPQK